MNSIILNLGWFTGYELYGAFDLLFLDGDKYVYSFHSDGYIDTAQKYNLIDTWDDIKEL